MIRNLTCKHLLEQRFARCLLTVSNRLEADSFVMAHAVAARLLDVRRAGVSEAAEKLQRARLIDYRSSEIRILDFDGLERSACECYGRIRSELQHFLRMTKKNLA